MKTINRLKVVVFAALCALAVTSAHAATAENGLGWNGLGWNGLGWNGLGWNGGTPDAMPMGSNRTVVATQLMTLASQPLE